MGRSTYSRYRHISYFIFHHLTFIVVIIIFIIMIVFILKMFISVSTKSLTHGQYICLRDISFGLVSSKGCAGDRHDIFCKANASLYILLLDTNIDIDGLLVL